MEELSLSEVQEKLFEASAQRSSEELPGKLTLALGTDRRALEDVIELKERKLLTYDFAMKSHSVMTPVSNPDHMLSCVAYYGDAVNGYYCVGYALGCINEDGTAIEIDFIEKRHDASQELHSKFLPIIVDAFATYGLYLNMKGMAKIDKMVLVSPVSGVVRYYKEQGYKHVEDYDGRTGVPAMVMNLESTV